MNDYYALRVEVTPGECTTDYTDLLAAFLADAGYESFEPDERGLTAYIRADLFDSDEASRIVNEVPISVRASVSHELIEGKDWNEEWEKNYFKPIVIGKRCVIHSTFHKDVPQAQYDIVIDPRMAFGTGHHFTTRLILTYLLEIDESGLHVIDVGTGTGILAILCKMRGAERVDAIEIDPPAYENACDHVKLNQQDINLILGDASALSSLPAADLLIANINRNIILGDMGRYSRCLKSGGRMILSGFYEEDIPVLLKEGARHSLSFESKKSENNWVAIELLKD